MTRRHSASIQSARRLAVRVTHAYEYLLYLPDGYGQKKRWPLLVFLHGRGERGSDLERLKRHGPPKLIEEGWRFPFVVVSPQCPEDEWWNYPALEAFIDAIVLRHRADATRIYLTGMSMGGFATWALAQHRPERYAAIIPICGGGEVRLAANLRKLPVWAFHGARDPVIPIRRSREMVAAIRSAGGAPRLTVYAKEGHDAWTRTYSDPDIYAWLITHSRKNVSNK